MCQSTHAVNVPKIKKTTKKHPCVVITFGGLSALPLNLEMRRSALSCILGMCMGPGSVRCSGIRSCQWRSFQTCRFWVQLRKTKAPGCVLRKRHLQRVLQRKLWKSKLINIFFSQYFRKLHWFRVRRRSTQNQDTFYGSTLVCNMKQWFDFHVEQLLVRWIPDSGCL